MKKYKIKLGVDDSLFRSHRPSKSNGFMFKNKIKRFKLKKFIRSMVHIYNVAPP